MTQTIGGIGFSRPSCYDGSKKIMIEIDDKVSGCRLLTLEMTPEDFAEAITGLHGVRCKVEAHRTDLIGMKRERCVIESPMPKCSWHERKEVAYEVCKEEAPEDVEVMSHFSSQNSFFYKDDQEWCRTMAFSYSQATQEDLDEAWEKRW